MIFTESATDKQKNNLCPLLQNGFPSRDGSVVLRYIPDPTDKLLEEAFQPAPGKYPPISKSLIQTQ